MHLLAAAGGQPALPATAADWAAASQADLSALWGAWTDDVLVDVSASHLLAAVPGVAVSDPPQSAAGASCAPLHIITYFYGRLFFASGAARARDLEYEISPAAFARAEAFVHRAAPATFEPTTAAVLVQRLELFMRGMPAPVPGALVLADDDFVKFEDHGAAAAPAG